MRAALRGTVLGLAGAAAGILAALVVLTLVREGPIGVPGALGAGLFITAFMVFLAAPGAFILALPLASTLRFVLANVPGRRTFLALGAAAGIPLGLVNLYIAHALLDLLLGKCVMIRWDWFLDPVLGPASVSGGAGLGLGVALAVWREAHAHARRRREWRGMWRGGPP